MGEQPKLFQSLPLYFRANPKRLVIQFGLSMSRKTLTTGVKFCDTQRAAERLRSSRSGQCELCGTDRGKDQGPVRPACPSLSVFASRDKESPNLF
ncbi:hypothetical protein RRG08_004147 [Elysia crispata]|uniref:Uncharacterized protein n=1 Tax=Elysia crispata TaxID=231223 RepID=A0AAE1D5Q5_9GAST|nr:hypothetical protein RRG08_004147 [Elysia crispata]